VYTAPYVGQGSHPQVTRGAPVPPIDFLGNLLALPGKLILWNWQFANHSVSDETEAVLVRYLEARSLPAFEDTAYRINQYSPIQDLHALIKNKHVAWPYRLLLGLPLTFIYDVVLPGRLFPWGDYYNPYTNTAHLYSDDPAVALHEAGHAYDFSDFGLKGTYALLRIVPFMDLYQEWQASELAINHLIDVGDRDAEFRAYKTLFPAYGTYAGSYLPIPFGSLPGALVGHLVGRSKAAAKRRYYEHYDAVLGGTAGASHVSGKRPAPVVDQNRGGLLPP
jgi:hypothetical protein